MKPEDVPFNSLPKQLQQQVEERVLYSAWYGTVSTPKTAKEICNFITSRHPNYRSLADEVWMFALSYSRKSEKE